MLNFLTPEMISQMSTKEINAAIELLRSELNNRPDSDKIYMGWSTEDVLEVCPDLTEDQARQVLSQAYHKMDASIGISWDVLEATASVMF